jgi:hypothetical protein
MKNDIYFDLLTNGLLVGLVLFLLYLAVSCCATPCQTRLPTIIPCPADFPTCAQDAKPPKGVAQPSGLPIAGCTPGEIQQSGCNTCTCAGGNVWSCTLAYCGPYAPLSTCGPYAPLSTTSIPLTGSPGGIAP